MRHRKEEVCCPHQGRGGGGKKSPRERCLPPSLPHPPPTTGGTQCREQGGVGGGKPSTSGLTRRLLGLTLPQSQVFRAGIPLDPKFEPLHHLFWDWKAKTGDILE